MRWRKKDRISEAGNGHGREEKMEEGRWRGEKKRKWYRIKKENIDKNIYRIKDRNSDNNVNDNKKGKMKR